MSKFDAFGVVLGVATCAALAGGCSGETAPPLMLPDGTFEQVVNNANYAEELGTLSVRQQIDFKTSNEEQVHIYNLTDTPLKPQSIKGLVEYFVKIGEQGKTRTVNLHPEENQTEQVTIIESPRQAAEHDILLVPTGTPMPDKFQTPKARGATLTLSVLGQTITVIKQPEHDGKPTTFEDGSELYVEACQAIVAESATQPEDTEDKNLGSVLAQETMCNSYGRAIVDAISGVPYDKYVKRAAEHRGHVSFNSSGYDLTPYIFPPSEYAAMKRIH